MELQERRAERVMGFINFDNLIGVNLLNLRYPCLAGRRVLFIYGPL